MSWFKKLLPSMIRTDAVQKKEIPEGIWAKCDGCQAILYRAELDKNLEVCPKCNHHHRLTGRRRIHAFLDQESFDEIGMQLEPEDKLKFKDSKRYKDRLISAQRTSQEKDALIVGSGRLYGMPIAIASFEFGFMGGSMGAIVGQKFVLAVEKAIELRCPFICFSASGGARMQEALISLFQMAKTSAALAKLSRETLPYLSVLTDPTMGGVSASFAMLGDIIVAEPRALIGFAGPRVIEQTVRQILPEGFQRSEFLLEHGAIDQVIPRQDMRLQIARLLAKLMKYPSPKAC